MKLKEFRRPGACVPHALPLDPPMLLLQKWIQWLGGWGKKHEIYAATFGSHLFYD